MSFNRSVQRLELDWYAPGATDYLTFSLRPPFVLKSFDGLDYIPVNPNLLKGPGQIGQSLSDISIDGRTITLTLHLFADTEEIAWTQRELLSARSATVPLNPWKNAFPKLGVLRAWRPGYFDMPLDIDAIVSKGPIFDTVAQGWYMVSISFFCPFPFWRQWLSNSVLLASAGGFVWPINISPFIINSYNVQQEIINPGTVPSPLLIQIFGDITSPRITNLTTGESIEILQQVPPGSYYEINTAYGRKSVYLVDSAGTRTNVINRINLSRANFFQLQPGSNIIKLDSAANASGSAKLGWTQLVAGI